MLYLNSTFLRLFILFGLFFQSFDLLYAHTPEKRAKPESLAVTVSSPWTNTFGAYLSCVGGEILFHASASGGSGTYTYTWSIVSFPNPATYIFTPNGSETLFKSSTAGTHKVKVEVSDGVDVVNVEFNVVFINSDLYSPKITILSNTTAECGSIVPDYVAMGHVIVGDNCKLDRYEQTPAAGTTFSATTTVKVEAWDDAGNSSDKTFTVTVSDTQAPTISPCTNKTLPSAGPINTIPDYASLVSDACDASPSIVQTPLAGSTTSLTSVPITITAEDDAGNFHTCNFTLTFSNSGDTQAPTITKCPADQDLTAGAGCGGATLPKYLPDNADISDNVDSDANLIITQSPLEGTLLSAGTHTIFITVADQAGNQAHCNFEVQVQPENARMILGDATACESQILEYELDAPNRVGSSYAWTITNGTILQTLAGGKKVRVQWNTAGTGSLTAKETTAGSCAGTQLTSNKSIIINALAKPVITGDMLINCPTATGNYQISSPITGHTYDWTVLDGTFTNTTSYSGDNVNILWKKEGQVSIKIDNNYPSGCTTTEYITVNLGTDTEKPQYKSGKSCPLDISLVASTGNNSAIANWTPPEFLDNCTPSVNISSSHTSGATFTIGFTTVRYDAWDNANNFVTCQFQVEVKDTEKPTLTACPTSTYVKNVSGCSNVAVDYSSQLPTYWDNSGTVIVIPDPTHPSGAMFEVGKIQTVTYRYQDPSGNEEICTFDISVRENVAPVFTSCPSNITIAPDAGKNYATLNYPEPQANDNCGAVVLTLLTPSYASGQQVTLDATGSKIISIEYEIKDPSGNKSSTNCQFNITITDQQPPVIQLPTGLPADKIMEIDAGNDCQPIVNYSVTATDNHQIDKLERLQGIASGQQFPLGFTTIEYKATDMAGNTKTELFYVKVVDNSPPNAPDLADIKADADIGKCVATVSWVLPSVLDNCGGSITITRTDSNTSYASGDEFPVGTTEIKYKFKDQQGNFVEKSFQVIVQDKQAPVFTKCPSDILVNATTNCDASVNFEVEISDNCLGESFSQTKGFPSGSVFPFGETEMEFIAQDAAGNFATCSFRVTVEDKIAPFMSVPMPITINANASSCTTEVHYIFPKTSDNCPNFTTVVEIISGVGTGQVFPNNTLNVTAEFPVGITNQVFKVRDAAGNETTGNFTITIQDGETPSFTSCPNNMIIPISSNNANCGTVVTYELPQGTDNCESTVEFVTGLPSGAVFPTGTTRVEYLIKDAVGNGIICGFNVSVMDSIAPQIQCPENVFITTDAGKCNAVFLYNFPLATDNCGTPNVSLKSGIGSGNAFPIGQNEEVLQAIDASGNITECRFTVTVVDSEPPAMECPDDIAVSSDPTVCGAVIKYQDPFVKENCKTVSVKMLEGLPSGSVFPVGFTTITYLATDTKGLETTCTFYVEVIDDRAPEITCPSDIIVDNEIGLEGATVEYPYFQIQDGCQSGITAQLLEGKESGEFFEIGEHLIRYKITDADSNFVTCSFKIIVQNAVKFELKQPKAVCFPQHVDMTDSTLVVGSTPNSTFEYYPSAEDAAAGKNPLANPDSLFTGLYYMKIISPLGAIQIAEIQINTDHTPDTTLTVSDPVFCSGGMAKIEITGAEKNVIYQLIDNETGTLVGSQVEGDGFKATLEIQPDTAKTYRVWASTKFAGCSEQLADNAVVTFDSRLSGDLQVTGGTICGGGEVEIKLYNSDPAVDYQLRFDTDSAEVSQLIEGNGKIITFPVKPSETTKYHILAILKDGGCEGILANKPTVTVVSQNNGFVTVGDPKICQNQVGEIILQNTDATLNYSLYIDNQSNNILQSKSGTGGDLSFSVSPARNTTYAIRVTADALNCQYDLLDKAQVTVLQPLSNNNITSSQTVCTGVEPQLLLGTFPTGGDGAPSYYWEESENGETWKPARGDNRKPDYQPKGLANTTYFRRIVLTENCTDNVSAPIEIKVIPAPKGGDLSGSSTVFRGQNKGRLVLSGHTGEILKWQFSNDRFINEIQELDLKASSHNFLNLTKTTWFRVVIRNEICGEVYSDTAQVLVTDKPVMNNNPIAVRDFIATERNQSITANLLENDSDPNADILIMRTLPLKSPLFGEVILSPDGTFTYTPKVDYLGLDSFQYEVCDDRIDSTLCATAWVVISIETDDSDGDGIPNSVEKGKNPQNPVDSDADGNPDYLDLDSDADGIPDAIEAGKTPRNPVDTDNDGTPDYLDLDSDNDLILDKYEGWIEPSNPPDTDGDNILNFRDLDSDNDGIPDEYEGKNDLTISADAPPVDTDNDGIPDYMDLDSDNDQRPDNQEAGSDPTNPVDRNQNGIPEFREPFEALKIYNVFTPNGDGDNDIWHIDGITEYENNAVRIFERDGLMIFEMKNYDNIDNVWRGGSNLLNIKKLPEGTYFYQIDLGDEGIRKGFVVLKRQR